MLKLCKGCVEALKIYNPYIDENGHQIPIEKLDIKIVPKEKCDNSKLNKTKKIEEKEYKCDYCNRYLYNVGSLVFDDYSIGIYCSLECYLKAKGEPIHRRLYNNQLLKELRNR